MTVDTATIKRLGKAVRQATAEAPRPSRQRVAVPMRAPTASDEALHAFHEYSGALIGGRYAIKRIPGQRGYEIWDTDSSAVFGPYRTHSDAAIAAEDLP